MGGVNPPPNLTKWEEYMSIDLKLRKQLPKGAVFMDNSSYDNSIIGTTLDGGIIYSLERMVEEYMVDNECSEEDALDWIHYNTIRAIPYAPDPKPMIVSEVV